MMKVTTAAPAERQLIQAYGDGGFRVSGITYRGSIIILPRMTMEWTVQSYKSVTSTNLKPLSTANSSIELLLIGCGVSMQPPRAEIRNYLKELNITPEWMDTGAACRTYNVLASENRAVGAALIAVD